MVSIIILIIIHIFGDYFLQSFKVAKSKAIKIPFLLKHVAIYTVVLIIACPILLEFSFLQGLIFSLINGALHLCVDFFTMKLKRKYENIYESKYVAVVIVDHIAHIGMLIITFYYMKPELTDIASLFFK